MRVSSLLIVQNFRSFLLLCSIIFFVAFCCLICFVPITLTMGNSWAKQLVGNNKTMQHSSSLEQELLCKPSEANVEKFLSNKLQPFCFDDLKKATKNFRRENLLGEGRDGHVFKGWIDENTYAPTKPGSGVEVAIKKLVRYKEDEEEWLAEVNYLGQLHHENLVKLIGYCLEGETRLLVYEFMSKGSLENHLITSGEPIAWDTRVNIAIGVARGIAFLHFQKENVIFLHLRASTILLDSDFNAKLSNFGLATDCLPEESGDCTMNIPRSITSYWAHELLSTDEYTPKSEVFSFGVVLLELLTGRRAFDRDRSNKLLMEWAQPFLNDRGKVLRIMDAKLGGQYSKRGAKVAAALAWQCIHSIPKYRPPIGDVLAALERLHSLDTIPRTTKLGAQSHATKHSGHS